MVLRNNFFMLVLVINCGSSSLKFQLINTLNSSVLAKGAIEEIGLNARIKFNGEKYFEKIIDHEKAFKTTIEFDNRRCVIAETK